MKPLAELMKTNVNLNTIITTVVAGLVLFLLSKVDENYALLIRVKSNQDSVLARLDKFENRMNEMESEISRISGELEILKTKVQ